MNEKIERIKIERTKRNLPALWEHGGGWTNTGSSIIIAGCDGEMPVATYVRKNGPIGGDHALIIIKPGMTVIKASHHNSDFNISIMRIEKIDDDDYAEVKIINEFSQGEWDTQPEEKYHEAIKAAMKKAQCYHCGGPFYVLPPEKHLPI